MIKVAQEVLNNVILLIALNIRNLVKVNKNSNYDAFEDEKDIATKII